MNFSRSEHYRISTTLKTVPTEVRESAIEPEHCVNYWLIPRSYKRKENLQERHVKSSLVVFHLLPLQEMSVDLSVAHNRLLQQVGSMVALEARIWSSLAIITLISSVNLMIRMFLIKLLLLQQLLRLKKIQNTNQSLRKGELTKKNHLHLLLILHLMNQEVRMKRRRKRLERVD